MNNEGSYYIGLDDFTSLGEPRIYSSLNITGESISGDLQTLMHFDNLSVLIKTPATPLPSPTSSLAPTPQPSVDGPKIDLPGPIDIPIPFLPTPTPISIPTPIPTAVPTPLPTPLPVLPAGNNWGTKSELVCKNGEVPAKPERTRLIYTIWPDEPYDLNAPIKFNKTEFSYADPAVQVISIKNRLDISSAYIAVETESGQFLLPTGKVAHRDMTYAQFFGVNMVKWSKGGIPAGYYTIQFQLPNSWCE